MSKYNIVASSSDSTVVAEYKPDLARAASYQSEADLESELLQLFQSQGYEYLKIQNEAELIANLRRNLELLL